MGRLDLDLGYRRQRVLLTQQGFHGSPGYDGLCLSQQPAQGLVHRHFTPLRRQIKNLQVLPRSPRWLRLLQHVVGQPKTTGRKQLFPKAILRQRTRLAYQPIDHVPIIDPLLAAATQTRQLLHAFLPVPHLHVLRVDLHLDLLADQPAVHRIDVVLHPDQTAARDRHTHTLATLQAARRQGLEHGLFFGKTPLPRAVPLPRHFLQECRVLLPAGKIPASPQQQRLLHRLLEMPMRRFHIAIFMRCAAVDLLAHEAVVAQQRLITPREILIVREIIDRAAHAVAAMAPRHAPQLPQGVL
jgi:hypothetical protein